ncbi:MAG: hypothetical protein ABI703_11390 [Gemmatimonadales bacterium]
MIEALPAAQTTSMIDLDTTFLPVAQMRQISRVTRIQDATISGEMDLESDHWVWSQHFPTDPIFPGSLLIEAAGQIVALWAWAQGARGRPRLVRTGAEFHNPVDRWTPGLRLTSHVRKKRHLYFGSVQIWSGETLVATVDAVLVVLDSQPCSPPSSTVSSISYAPPNG